jgi:hypothetical protein
VVNEVAMKWKRSVGTSRIVNGWVTSPALRIVEVGKVLTRDYDELAALDHDAHYWLCLYVKTAEHRAAAITSGTLKAESFDGVDRSLATVPQ